MFVSPVNLQSIAYVEQVKFCAQALVRNFILSKVRRQP
jgi:hypothetical protein